MRRDSIILNITAFMAGFWIFHTLGWPLWPLFVFYPLNVGVYFLARWLVFRSRFPRKELFILLRKAIQNGDLGFVKKYIPAKISANFRFKWGVCTWLCDAVDAGQYDITEYLLDRGANPNKKCCQHPVLKFAINKGHQDIVKLLLDRGANPFKKDYYSDDMIKVARSKSQLMVDILEKWCEERIK